MALRTLSVRFEWDKKDQEGSPEQLAATPAGKLWVNTVEKTPATVTLDSTQPDPLKLVGTVSADADIVPGVLNAVEIALIDNEGTVGSRRTTPFTLQDSGPTAPIVLGVTSVPKP